MKAYPSFDEILLRKWLYFRDLFFLLHSLNIFVCASYSGGDIFGSLHNIHRSNTRSSGGRWIDDKYDDVMRILPALILIIYVYYKYFFCINNFNDRSPFVWIVDRCVAPANRMN